MQLLKLSTYILLSICVSFAASNNDCSEYTTDINCNMHDHCWWDSGAAGGSGECVNDGGNDGPPECLSECVGVDDIDGDDPMQVCGFLEPIWEVSGSCADDCANDEAYMELDMIAYMCEGCYDAANSTETTCVDWFDFLDDHDPCGQCHDACGDNNQSCHDNCEANECACDDDDPCCQCHDTCGDDDTCHQNCDEGDCAADDGPPECLSECEGIDAIDPEEDASGFCTWLTATGTDISSCSSGCDAELLTELDMMNWMCTGCLAEDPDGTMGTCEYWLDFKGDDPCGQCHDACGDDSNCHNDCDEYECGGDDNYDDCHQYTSDTDCNMYDHCWWENENNECVHDYDGDDEGPPSCLMDCTGIDEIDPEGDIAGFCTFLDGIWEVDGSCADDCGMEESMMLAMMNFMCEMYDECIAEEGNSESDCEQWFDMDDEYGNDCAQYDDDQTACENTPDCQWDGMYCNPDYEDDCNQYTSDTDCNMYDHCWWDPNVGTAGECHQEGPPDCVNDCAGFSSMTPQTSHTDWCTWLSDVWENGSASCMTDCNADDMTKLTADVSDCTTCLANNDCDQVDDCNQYDNDQTTCDNTQGCHWDDTYCVHDDGDYGPECLSDCEGIEGVNPEGDPFAFCTWASGLSYFSECMDGCEADVLAEIASYASTCTACIIANNCDEAELSINEKNLLLPEAFSLHPVYPNPFNPTTDIGFSLELAGPVSISVYDVTGRRVETILHNKFQNAGSYIINWNGSQFPSGIYFIHLQAGKQIAKQKITLLK